VDLLNKAFAALDGIPESEFTQGKVSEVLSAVPGNANLMKALRHALTAELVSNIFSFLFIVADYEDRQYGPKMSIIVSILGKERTLDRIRKALDFFSS
jgi:hypothetical protein